MKTKIILTLILITVLFWAGFHFAEKKQKDQIENWEVKEKLKNNHDSILLSDLVITYKERRLTNVDSFPKVKHPDHSAVISINLYDNTSQTIELPTEKIVFKAYQNESEIIEKFPKSNIHIVDNLVNCKGRREWDRYITIFNRDTLSNINCIRTYFYNGQVQKINIMLKTAKY